MVVRFDPTNPGEDPSEFLLPLSSVFIPPPDAEEVAYTPEGMLRPDDLNINSDISVLSDFDLKFRAGGKRVHMAAAAAPAAAADVVFTGPPAATAPPPPPLPAVQAPMRAAAPVYNEDDDDRVSIGSDDKPVVVSAPIQLSPDRGSELQSAAPTPAAALPAPLAAPRSQQQQQQQQQGRAAIAAATATPVLGVRPLMFGGGTRRRPTAPRR